MNAEDGRSGDPCCDDDLQDRLQKKVRVDLEGVVEFDHRFAVSGVAVTVGDRKGEKGF